MPTKTTKRIMIIDDESPIAEMISDFCRAFDFETLVMDDGENVLENALAFKPDLVILDLVMPKVSGVEVVEILKQHNETKNIPIIIVSSLAGETSVEDVLKPCQAILSKPVKLEVLKENINSALSTPA